MTHPYFDVYLTNAADVALFAPPTRDGGEYQATTEALSHTTRDELRQWLDIDAIVCVHFHSPPLATIKQLFTIDQHAYRQLLQCTGDAAIVNNNHQAHALKRGSRRLASVHSLATPPADVKDSFEMTNILDRPWICPADTELAAITPGASLVSVVEMVHVRGDFSLHLGARYVLRQNGTLVTIAASAHSANVTDDRTSRIPDVGDTYVTRETPETWLSLLPVNFSGSRYYATKVFQMDEYAAVRSMLVTRREDKHPAPASLVCTNPPPRSS